MSVELSLLEGRLKHELPEEYHEDIEREFARFECEAARMSPDDEKIGQASLTKHEIRRLPLGNQHTDTFTLIEYQGIKGAAMHYGVSNWIEKIDHSLTYEENIDLMRQKGTETGPTMREMKL